jgi:hypothetical protein
MVEQVLFKFPEYVQLWQTDRNVGNTNYPMIQYNTKIYKGANNKIDFVVRNNDRKPVNLVGYQISALIQRVEQPELLLDKPVQATDDRAGKAQLVLSASDVEDWLEGFYRYTIRITDITGNQEFLYTDVNRSTFGTFELIEGFMASLAPATELPSSKFTPYPYGYYDNTWSTGALPGDSQDNRANGMHTVVVYTTNWFGEFRIQGSLQNQPPTEKDWFDITLAAQGTGFEYTRDYNPPIKVFNFTGNYYWIRMFYKNDPMNKGSFDKILYKN